MKKGEVVFTLSPDIRLSWNGTEIRDLLDEVFASFITTDDWSEKTEGERKEQVYFFRQIRSVVETLDQQIINTV